MLINMPVNETILNNIAHNHVPAELCDNLMFEGLDGGSRYSLITKNLAIYSLSLKFWLIH